MHGGKPVALRFSTQQLGPCLLHAYLQSCHLFLQIHVQGVHKRKKLVATGMQECKDERSMLGWQVKERIQGFQLVHRAHKVLSCAYIAAVYVVDAAYYLSAAAVTS